MSKAFQERITPTRCRSYVKYPDPARPRASGQHPWKTADLCAAYGLARNSQAGGGVIGILELGGGWTQSDLDLFSRLNGLPRIAVTDVSMDGAGNAPGDDADGEVALDIQVAAAAYFYLTGKLPAIRVYWAGNTADAFAAAIARAAADGCDVLSISWGTSENNLDAASVRACEAAAAAAAKLGMVVTAAAGDNSASDGLGGVTVDFPSCCPSIVACGGTMKTDGAESAWGTGSIFGSGTGGGFSKVFSKPAYQSIGPANPGRMVPDVSAVADPNTGYLIVLNGQQIAIGGTSAVAPLYAGLYAAFGRKLGAANPTQWANPGAFGDIVTGSNGWKAIPGPDACTGLGVPTARLPAVFVAAPPPPVVPPTPPDTPTVVDMRGTLTVQKGRVTGFAASAADAHGLGSFLGDAWGYLTGELQAGLETAVRWVDEYGSDIYGVADAARTVLASGTSASVADLIDRVKKLIADLQANNAPPVALARARTAVPNFDWKTFLSQLLQALLGQLLAPPAA